MVLGPAMPALLGLCSTYPRVPPCLPTAARTRAATAQSLLSWAPVSA
jgi:hypothetical protein